MRILHVIGWINFVDGGPPVIATRLAAAQAVLGHQVSIASYSSDDDPITLNRLASVPNWNLVMWHRFPPCGRVERLRGTDAARHLAPLIEAADVVHLHNVWEGILIRAANLARRERKPYVILLNGMLEPWSLTKGRFKKRLALSLTHRRMLQGSALLQLGNADEEKSVRAMGITAPAAVIPNGVSLDEIDPLPSRGEFFAAHPALAGRRFVLFLGRLHRQKGVDYLVDAFAELAPGHPGVDLVIAGPDGGAQADLTRPIDAAKLGDRCHLIGPVYGREKFAAMVDCECFVLPSRHEGFSVALLEAMACGAPVVASTACHFPDIASGGAGEVVELSAGNLAAAMGRIVSDPERSRMGQRGRTLVESQYTWHQAAVRTIAAYESALSRQNRPSVSSSAPGIPGED
ncbi:MAG: glycosyltransferase [Tepidisphaeraceae bacterium]|jgi:glycosyltransferase involved in cell wall biosynthesis